MNTIAELIEWRNLWLNTTYAVVLLLVLRLYTNKSNITLSKPIIYLIGAFIVWFFVAEPLVVYSDKWAYLMGFNDIIKGSVQHKGDVGFFYFNVFVGYFTHSVEGLFLFIAIIYVFGYIKFINCFFDQKYRFVVFVLTICSLGFYAYGTNTLRQGMALSFFLIALTMQNISWKYWLLLVLSVSFHKSLAIIILFYLLSQKIQNTNWYYLFWIGCLLLTIAISEIGNILGAYLIPADERMEGYLFGENETYQAGFKFNFLIYSLFPILYGTYVRRKFKDPFYIQMFHTYLAVNAFWLLMIRLPFTDRFAYLSWCLIPFIFMYPMSKKQIFKNQHVVIALLLFGLATINYFVS